MEDLPGAEELEIELVGDGSPDLPWGDNPLQQPGHTRLALGKPAEGPVLVAAYPCVKQLLAHGQRSLEQEVAGVLLGRIWRCEAGRVTQMQEALAAERTEAGLGHVTFSHETWNQIHEYLETCAAGLRIVGWYHTHPGLGVFYSEQDRFIQCNFFAAAGQIGLVYDPRAEALAAFETRGGEVEPLPGLWVAAPAESVKAARGLLNRLSFTGPGPSRNGLLSRLGKALGERR